MKRIVLILMILAAAGGGAWYGYDRLTEEGESGAPKPDVYIVSRGPFDVTIVDSASLKAERSVNLKSELEGKAAITSIVPEGTTVQKGEKLLVLDTSEIKEREENQQINVARSEADLAAAEKEVSIQESKNASELSKAEDQVLFAGLDLKKFLGEDPQSPISDEVSTGAEADPIVNVAVTETTNGAEEIPSDPKSERLGEKEQQITKTQADVDTFEDEVDRARKKLKWTKELHARKYVSDDDLETDQLALQRFENQLRHARNSLFILKNYTLVRQEREFRAKLSLAEAELERTRLRCAAEMVQKQAMVAAKKQQLDLEKSKLEKYRKQIEAATIIAPSPGIVVYSQNFWDQNGPVVLKEGVEVRQGQGLIILPDLSSMIAQCKVHEAQMDRVEKGQRVTVRVEALKDQVFTGTVKRVGVLPDNEDGWMNPENKVYATTIALDGDTTMLRPGQSATAEIHVAHKDDVLSVPVQAVLRKGRVNYAWRLGEGSPEAVPVKTGITNDKFVEILDGLALGDRIALSWPTGAREPEFPDLERQLEQEEKDLAAKAAKAGEAETVPESQKPAGAPESPESKDGAGGKDGAAPGTAAPTSATSGSGAGFTSKATTDPKASGVEVPNGAR